MGEHAVTTQLRLSGAAADTFRLALPAGRRVQVSARDLDGPGDSSSAPLVLYSDVINIGVVTYRQQGAVALSPGNPASLILQFDTDVEVELQLSGTRGHDCAVTVQLLDADDHGDSPGTATPVTPGQSVALRLDAGGDRDLLAYDLPAGERLVFETTTPGIGLSLLDAAGQHLAWAESALAFDVPESGRYLLMARDLVDRDGVTAEIRSRHDDAAAGIDFNLLALGQPAEGRLNLVGEIDVYLLEAPPGQPLELRVSGDAVPGVFAYDNAGTWIDAQRGTDPDTGAHVMRLQAPDDGVLLLNARSWTGTLGSYRILATVSSPDDHAPDLAHATWIEPGQTLAVRGDGVADVDALRWQVQPGVRYGLSIDLPASEDGAFAELGDLSQTSGPTGYGLDADGRTELGLTLPDGGEGWLKLSGLPAGAGSVSLRIVADDDHADTLGLATPVTPDAPARGFAGPGFDRDAFRVLAAPGEGVRVRVQATDGGDSWPVALHLFDGSGQQLAMLGFDGDQAPFDLPPFRTDDDGVLLAVLESRDEGAREYLLTVEPVAMDRYELVVDHGELPIRPVGVDDPTGLPGDLAPLP